MSVYLFGYFLFQLANRWSTLRRLSKYVKPNLFNRLMILNKNFKTTIGDFLLRWYVTSVGI